MLYLTFFFFILIAKCTQYLNDIPITFQIKGIVTYTPDVSSSDKQTGYTINLGFDVYSWIGIKFIPQNQLQNNDILIIQRNNTYTNDGSSSGYEVTVNDYYIVQGNPDVLNQDQLTSLDLTTTTFVDSNQFNIQFIRSISNNLGQDWNAANYQNSMLNVCFFTSNSTFSIDSWKGSYTSCYGYEITNLISTYRGSYLKNITLNGISTPIYGGVQGPFLVANIFLYHAAPLGTYTKPVCVILDIGTISDNLGRDYYVSSSVSSQSGDYNGADIKTMTKDLISQGFEDSNMSIQYQNVNSNDTNSNATTSNIKISFSRFVFTTDGFDIDIGTPLSFCLYFITNGSLNGNITSKVCDSLKIGTQFPYMKLDSAILTSELKLNYLLILIMVIIITIL